jgi:hypothetical protein
VPGGRKVCTKDESHKRKQTRPWPGLLAAAAASRFKFTEEARAAPWYWMMPWPSV